MCTGTVIATDLVDHVAFWMPAFVTHVPIDLHELLQNCSITACAFCRKARRIMVMTVHVIIVFIIRVLRPEKCWTYGACEMLDVELSVCMGVSRIWIIIERGCNALHAVI